VNTILDKTAFNG